VQIRTPIRCNRDGARGRVSLAVEMLITSDSQLLEAFTLLFYARSLINKADVKGFIHIILNPSYFFLDLSYL
jgi:hypothetical protein